MVFLCKSFAFKVQLHMLSRIYKQRFAMTILSAKQRCFVSQRRLQRKIDLAVQHLFINLFSQVIIEKTDKSNHYSREYTSEKINANIEDIFGWEATRNHRDFTWGLPGTDKLNTYNVVEIK